MRSDFDRHPRLAYLMPSLTRAQMPSLSPSRIMSVPPPNLRDACQMGFTYCDAQTYAMSPMKSKLIEFDVNTADHETSDGHSREVTNPLREVHGGITAGGAKTVHELCRAFHDRRMILLHGGGTEATTPSLAPLRVFRRVSDGDQWEDRRMQVSAGHACAMRSASKRCERHADVELLSPMPLGSPPGPSMGWTTS